MKPFIDNQRGATMRHKAHRAATEDTLVFQFKKPDIVSVITMELKESDAVAAIMQWKAAGYQVKILDRIPPTSTPKHFWQSRTIWLIAAFVALAMLLSGCLAGYSYPGLARTPDPAYEGWGEDQ